MTRIARLDYPKRNIRMFITTPIEETFRLHACEKEPWTVSWLESMPRGSVLYDVGACVGSYTLIAASLGHTVVAIEPSFANYARLCENVLLNGYGDKVIPVCFALGGHGGTCELMEQELQPGYSGGAKRLRVPTLPLLDVSLLFGAPFPTHIKLDTDGHEYDVISGTEALLERDVSWMVEVQTGQDQRIHSLLGPPSQVFDQRNGQKIQGMSMQLFDPKRILASA